MGRYSVVIKRFVLRGCLRRITISGGIRVNESLCGVGYEERNH